MATTLPQKIAAMLSWLGLTLAGAQAQAQTRWDLPAAYASSNFHTQLLQEFAADVAQRSQGKLVITVHHNASGKRRSAKSC